MKTALIAFLGVITAILVAADTTQVPLRGYGPVSTNGGMVLYSGPRVVPQMTLSISKIPDTNGPPPLPQSITRARLRWVEGDIYKLENVDPGDTIVSPNKPTVTRGKTGWVITF